MLHGHSISLRHVTEADLATLIPLLNNLELRGEYLPSAITAPNKTREQFKENGLSTEQYERLLIVDKADVLLGTIVHFKSVPYFNAREIGYVLFDTELRGKGLVTQVVGLLVQHLFHTTHINRLELRMTSHNLASERVAQKCGFQKEGVARAANFVRGKHVDMKVYALLRAEFEATQLAM